jgi:hypothetical protein
MKYVQATNTGKGFVTHEDRALGHISGHSGDIYTVANTHTAWIARVGGVEKTLEEATAIVLAAAQSSWDLNNQPNETAEEKVKRIGDRPTSVELPK